MTDENDKDNNKSSLRESTVEILKNLTAQEAIALRERFGIDISGNLELEEIGNQFLITRQRTLLTQVRKIDKLTNCH